MKLFGLLPIVLLVVSVQGTKSVLDATSVFREGCPDNMSVGNVWQGGEGKCEECKCEGTYTVCLVCPEPRPPAGMTWVPKSNYPACCKEFEKKGR